VAYGDYIHCCKCDVKLIYDGDRGQRDWWIERFGTGPEIECPDCKKEWVGLTEQDVHDAFQFTELIKQLSFDRERPEWCENFAAYLEAKLKEKNGG
jgi:hypothetical protein